MPVSSRGQDTWFSATGPGFDSPYRYHLSKAQALNDFPPIHRRELRAGRCSVRGDLERFLKLRPRLASWAGALALSSRSTAAGRPLHRGTDPQHGRTAGLRSLRAGRSTRSPDGDQASASGSFPWAAGGYGSLIARNCGSRGGVAVAAEGAAHCASRRAATAVGRRSQAFMLNPAGSATRSRSRLGKRGYRRRENSRVGGPTLARPAGTAAPVRSTSQRPACEGS